MSDIDPVVPRVGPYAPVTPVREHPDRPPRQPPRQTPQRRQPPPGGDADQGGDDDHPHTIDERA